PDGTGDLAQPPPARSYLLEGRQSRAGLALGGERCAIGRRHCSRGGLDRETCRGLIATRSPARFTKSVRRTLSSTPPSLGETPHGAAVAGANPRRGPRGRGACALTRPANAGRPAR